MNIKDMKSSKFLKRGDVGDGVVVTIVGVELTNVGLESAPEDKWCLTLKEFPSKLMVLNGTNQQLIALALGSEETDDWIGQKIVLWDDESVMYLGKVVGGIRVKRAPGKVAAVGALVRDSSKGTDEEENVPF